MRARPWASTARGDGAVDTVGVPLAFPSVVPPSSIQFARARFGSAPWPTALVRPAPTTLVGIGLSAGDAEGWDDDPISKFPASWEGQTRIIAEKARSGKLHIAYPGAAGWLDAV